MNLEFRKYIKAVGTGPKLSRDLTVEEAERAFRLILSGEASDAQIGALLVPLRMKGESVEELAVFLKVTREFCRQIKVELPYFLDCGIAYDGKVKFPNISPLAAFVAAGAGAQILLHGQSQTPPKYGIGVRDVFIALGLSVDWTLEQSAKALEEVGVGFVSLEQISPRVSEFKRIREELGLRTVFNHIEKLWNPMNAPHQIVSIYHGPYLEKIPAVLRKAGIDHAIVIQGMEGSTDCRTARTTKAVEIDQDQIKLILIQPKDLGFEPLEEPIFDHLTPQLNAEFILSALEAQSGVMKDLAILNGAILIYASSAAKSLEEAVEKARISFNSKQALKKLEVLRRMAHSLR